jgi:lysophospholipase L1-like esterase
VGINDLKTIGVFPKRKDEITETCQKNLRTIVKQTTEHNTHVVVLTIFSPGTVGLLYRLIWSDGIREAVEKTNAMIRGLGGPRVTVVNCDPILSVGKTLKPEYARDTFHLNSAGYQAINNSIVPILEKLLQNYDLAEN